MIPNAKMDACEKAPPAKVSNRPSKPPFLLALAVAVAKRLGFSPGRTI